MPGCRHFRVDFVDIRPCGNRKSDHHPSGEIGTILPTGVPTLRERRAVDVKRHRLALRCRGDVMDAARRMPDGVMRNVHAELPVERDRGAGIAADDVDLVENNPAHPRTPTLAQHARRALQSKAWQRQYVPSHAWRI